MKKIPAVLLAALAVVLSMSAADAAPREIDRVYDFLEKNVVNRILVTESEGTIAGGKVAHTFRRETVLRNLVRSPSSLSFDAIILIKQRNWDVKDGQKVGEPRLEDRWLIIRTDISTSTATGQLIGLGYGVTNTYRAPAGSFSVRMRLDGDRLVTENQTNMFGDFFDKGGGTFPGAEVWTTVYFLQDGKLVRETRGRTYRVDPKTLERKPLAAETKPETKTKAKPEDRPMVDREVGRLPENPW